MHITTLFNNKGGTGKTTSAVSLADEFARAGFRTLLWDVDGQASATMWIGTKSEDLTPLDVLNGNQSVLDVAMASMIPGVDIVPAGPALEVADAHLHEHPFPQAALADVLEKAIAADRWDRVVIDAPPARGVLSTMALVAANDVIVPLGPTGLDLMSLPPALELINKVKDRLNPQLRVAGTVITKFDARGSFGKDVRAQLTERALDNAWVEIVPMNVKAAEAPAARSSIRDYAPNSPPAVAYRHIAQLLLNAEAAA